MKAQAIPRALYLAIGLMIGVVGFGAFRFFAYKPDIVHYHANFAMYINGVREEFKDPSYYEEVAACSKDAVGPRHRAHLHDSVGDVVHVHDHAVTWGQFFENIGYSLGDRSIATRTAVYVADDSHSLQFVLNGKTMASIANVVIGDRDRLLVSYGSESKAELDQRMAAVSSTADAVDHDHDPSSCSGAEAITTQDRLEHLFR
jgi:hypothetical protein